jgi:DNA-binding transcriptional regulator YbjK
VSRAPRGEARRGLILEAALQVVGEVGPDALTHRRVAEVAGVPLAATTYWFTSKADLLAETYRLAARREIDRVEALAEEAVAAGVAPEDVAPLLSRLAAAEVAAGRTGLIAAYALWIEAARRPELRGIERGWTEAYVSAVERVLRAAGAPSPALDARILVAALDGLVLEQVAMDEPGYARDVLEPALARLVDALFAAS